MTQARTASVTFKKRKYALTINEPENGAIQGADSGSQHEHGTEVTLTAVPDEGYELNAWAGVSSHDGLTAKVTMTQARTASVTFKKRKYALTINEPENGAIEGADDGSLHEHGTESHSPPSRRLEINAWTRPTPGACDKVNMTQARTASVTFKTQKTRSPSTSLKRRHPGRRQQFAARHGARSPSPPSPMRAMSSTRGPASPPMTADRQR